MHAKFNMLSLTSDTANLSHIYIVNIQSDYMNELNPSTFILYIIYHFVKRSTSKFQQLSRSKCRNTDIIK